MRREILLSIGFASVFAVATGCGSEAADQAAPAAAHVATKDGSTKCQLLSTVVRCQVDGARWQAPPGAPQCHAGEDLAVQLKRDRGFSRFVCWERPRHHWAQFPNSSATEGLGFYCAFVEDGVRCARKQRRDLSFFVSQERYRVDG
jgi:hypothetical protein